MKQLRRTAALLLTFVTLALALTVSASAKDANVEGNDYKIYQIFTGDTSNYKIENVNWGSAFNTPALRTALVTELKKYSGFGDLSSTDADVIAKKLHDLTYGLNTNDDVAAAFAKAAYQVIKANNVTGSAFKSGVGEYAAGYYLIVDVTDAETLKNLPGSARNGLVLLMTDNPGLNTLTVISKVEVPELEKWVWDEDELRWVHSTSYNKNNKVKFKLDCTLGDLDGFKSYTVIFEDTLNPVFIDPSSIKVFYNGAQLDNTYYSVDSTTLHFPITLPNVLAFNATKGGVITVEYDVDFKNFSSEAVGSYENKARVRYSSDPNNPDVISPTPEDEATVHCFKVVVNKTDMSGNPLSGAAFRLDRVVGKNTDGSNKYELVGEIPAGNTTTFTWDGLKAGKYVLTETAAPAKHIAIDPFVFTIEPDYDNNPPYDLLSVTVKDEDGNVISSGSNASFPVTDHTITASIKNATGTTLPDTGGRGTRLFYIFGSVLFLSGAVLLVTKRRMYDPE